MRRYRSVVLLALCLLLCACGETQQQGGYTDLQGGEYGWEALCGETVTMVNFWEYWCGPCRTELPDLQRLSEDYAAQGVQVLGVVSDLSAPEELEDTIAQSGITYPVLRYTSEFSAYQTGYVPTTVFLNREGELLAGPYVGAKSYEQWAEILEGLLNRED